MKAPKNPFVLAGYYGKAYFCNRNKELDQLQEHIHNERNVVLYSWRRTGKTALIKCFLHMLEQQNTETLYVDMLGSQNMAGAIKQITQAVYQRFGKTSAGFSNTFQKLLAGLGTQVSFNPFTGMPEFGIQFQPNESAHKTLNSLGEFLMNRKKPIVIALDEFQQISHYEKKQSEAYFRAWMQEFPSIRFIFSGSHRNMMRSMFTEANRPFYRSAQLLQLQAIEIQAYQEFIIRHFKQHKKTIGVEAIEELYVWSRMQTYCIQLICNKLFGKYDNIQTEHLQEVYTEILDQESPFFSNYSNLLTQMQWKVLSAVAKSEPLQNPLSKDFIHQHQLGAASSVNSALKMLIDKELIIKDDETYLVHDVLLARWLQTF